MIAIRCVNVNKKEAETTKICIARFKIFQSTGKRATIVFGKPKTAMSNFNPLQFLTAAKVWKPDGLPSIPVLLPTSCPAAAARCCCFSC